MYATAFEYLRASSWAEAVDRLEQLGEDAHVIAGGQSLVPMMMLRMAAPTALVDVGGAGERPVEVRDGTLELSAAARRGRGHRGQACLHRRPSACGIRRGSWIPQAVIDGPQEINMIVHASFGFSLIASCDGIGDRSVIVIDPKERLLAHTTTPHARLQNAEHRLCSQCEQGVVGGGDHATMEAGVELELFFRSDLAGIIENAGAYRLKLRGSSSRGRLACCPAFKQVTRFKEVRGGDIPRFAEKRDIRTQKVRYMVNGGERYKASTAGASGLSDQVVRRKRVECFADRPAAHTKLFCQSSLPWKPLSALEVAAHDHPAELLVDLLMRLTHAVNRGTKARMCFSHRGSWVRSHGVLDSRSARRLARKVVVSLGLPCESSQCTGSARAPVIAPSPALRSSRPLRAEQSS